MNQHEKHQKPMNAEEAPVFIDLRKKEEPPKPPRPEIAVLRTGVEIPRVGLLPVLATIERLKNSQERSERGALTDFINIVFKFGGKTAFGNDQSYKWKSNLYPQILKDVRFLKIDGSTPTYIMQIIEAMVDKEAYMKTGEIVWKNPFPEETV